MNKELEIQIEDLLHGSGRSEVSFPQLVEQLNSLGVESYHVDYIRKEEVVYTKSSETCVVNLEVVLPPISETFSASDVAAAVKSSQTEGQRYDVFADRVCRAGCTGYIAFLEGKRVVYYGRLGDQHIEYFPS